MKKKFCARCWNNVRTSFVGWCACVCVCVCVCMCVCVYAWMYADSAVRDLWDFNQYFSTIIPAGNRLGTGIAIHYKVGPADSTEVDTVKMTVEEGLSKKTGMAWVAAMQKVITVSGPPEGPQDLHTAVLKGPETPRSTFQRVPTLKLFLNVCGCYISIAVYVKFTYSSSKGHPGQTLWLIRLTHKIRYPPNRQDSGRTLAEI